MKSERARAILDVAPAFEAIVGGDPRDHDPPTAAARIPCGDADDGLPIGPRIVGPRGSDRPAAHAAAALEGPIAE